MLRLASIIVVAVGIASVQAAEPFRLVLTDVETNIYTETAEISIPLTELHTRNLRRQIG